MDVVDEPLPPGAEDDPVFRTDLLHQELMWLGVVWRSQVRCVPARGEHADARTGFVACAMPSANRLPARCTAMS